MEQQHVKKLSPFLPLCTTWLIDLLFENIHDTPNMSNEYMQTLLEEYATDYTITNNLLQNLGLMES